MKLTGRLRFYFFQTQNDFIYLFVFIYLFRYNRGGGYSNRGFNNRNNHGGYNRNNQNPNNLNRSLPSNQGSGKSDSRLNQSDIEPVSGSFKKTPKKEEPKVPTSLVNYEGSDDEDEDGLKECYYICAP